MLVIELREEVFTVEKYAISSSMKNKRAKTGEKHIVKRLKKSQFREGKQPNPN